MESPHLLKLMEKKELFTPAFETDEKKEINVTYLKNSRSAFRKLVKKSENARFIIESGREKEKLFQNKVSEYKEFTPDFFFPVLKKIFCKYIKKCAMELPLAEIYIIAPPQYVCGIISELHTYSRLFTVICAAEYQGKMYDEIYFKYGTLIRQMEVFNNDIRDDCAAVRISGKKVPLWFKYPVLDMSGDTLTNPHTLIMRNIHITDDFSRHAEAEWGGNSGITFFSLFGKKPSENARISIDEKADSIFLLDTNEF